MAFPYCYKCKGAKNLCGLGRCPLLERIKKRIPEIDIGGNSIEGPTPPSLFIGRYGYPRITVGPLAAPMEIPLPQRLESPSFLYERSMEEVYSMRSSLVRGKYRIDARISKEPGIVGSESLIEIEPKMPIRGRKVLSSVQEIALSSRSIDTEMDIKKIGHDVRDHPGSDSITMPMGPSINIDKVDLNQNPRVPVQVEKEVSDTDHDAAASTVDLFNAGIPTEHLVRLFSVGLLGVEKRRRLVPTRWTITAVDDILSRSIMERLSHMEHFEEYKLFSADRFGNHFLVALFPPPFRYEMLEQWQNDALWGNSPVVHDHEGPRGRTSYASRVTGAYYAARLSVVRYLETIRKNAGIAVLRWITNDYWAPLGVWVIRETVQKAMSTEPMTYGSMEALIRGIDGISGMKNWRSMSKYLTTRRMTTLDEFN